MDEIDEWFDCCFLCFEIVDYDFDWDCECGGYEEVDKYVVDVYVGVGLKCFVYC